MRPGEIMLLRSLVVYSCKAKLAEKNVPCFHIRTAEHVS